MSWKTRTSGTDRQRGKKFRTRTVGGRKEYYDPEMKVWKTSIFFPAKHKKYEEIVSLKSPEEATVSTEKLTAEFKDAETRAKRVRVLRVTVLASNRAYAMAKKKDLSKKERHEFRLIGHIYRSTAEWMKERLS